jgi:hypothetical protein
MRHHSILRAFDLDSGLMIDGGLFTRDFLHEGILETAAWQALAEDDVAAFKASITQMLAALAARDNPNEAETEDNLVYPLLEAIGWADRDVQPNASTKARSDVPDALLFADAATKATAGALKPKDRFRYGLAIVEAKRWQRPLDREDKSKASERGTPSSQMQRYLRIVEELSNGTLRWGILTNGRVWRLVSNSVLLQAEPFIEIDLGKLLQINGCPTDLLDKRPDVFASDAEWHDHTLRLFMLLFGRAAFLVGDGHETFHALALREGKNWEAKVAKSLANTVFKHVFPQLADAIAKADPNRPAMLNANYLDDVRQGALILLYRLLFVLYAEDRNLLPDESGPYAEYCLSKMRRDIAQRFIENKTYPGGVTQLWGRLTTIFDAISKGNDDLGIPPYNGGLFDPATAPILSRISLPDVVMANIIYGLSHQVGDGEPKYINYRDLSVQQLGSVYEQLLEYQLVEDAGQVTVTLNPFGRKSSGSYYTPDELVKLIIEETLSPLVEDAKEAFKARVKLKATIKELQGADPANAILNLRIVDPAMGSGHFLVSLVDWLTDHVREAMENAASEVDGYQSPLVARIAEIRARIETEAETRKWPIVAAQLNNAQIIRRMVLKRCVYGVDLNPMAVELAKVSLWLHSFTVGAPLSFLDHHLICGNALFGERVHPVMEWAQFGGNMFIAPMVARAKGAARGMAFVEDLTDADIAEAKSSKGLYGDVLDTTADLRSFMDLVHGLRWVGGSNKVEARAAKRLKAGDFGDPQGLFEGTVALPQLSATQTALLAQNDGTAKFSPAEKKFLADAEDKLAIPKILEATRAAIAREKFFHWEAAFPGVWQDWESASPKGGFDAVIGNPPWDRMKFQEVEWFADRRRDIAAATRASDRKRMVDALIAANDPLVEGYHAAIARAEGSARVARECGAYPLLSGGDTNLYSLFVERAYELVKPSGMVGLLTPSGIASDLTAAKFFSRTATGGHLKALFDFENRRTRYGTEPFFPDVDSRFKFCAIISSPKRAFDEAKCGFFLQHVSEIDDPERCFPLTAADFARVNPNTGTAPIFRSRRDANLTAQIYAHAPVLVDRSSGEEVKTWQVKYSTMFHMANDSSLFRTRSELAEKEGAWPVGGNRWQSKAGEWVPLYEGKMVQAYDHRASDITVNTDNLFRTGQQETIATLEKSSPTRFPLPRYFVQFPDQILDFKFDYTVAIKDVTAATNVRTVIAAFVPKVGAGHTLPLLLSDVGISIVAFVANLNSTIFDYVARQKVATNHLTWFVMEQLPVIPPQRFETTRFGPKTAAEIIREAVLELTYTAHDMAPFARDMGYVDEAGDVKPPFIWDETRRLKLRAKLDAVFFHFYGITSRDDIRYIYATFPIVERHEMADYGSYRSRDLCLAYMNALEAGQPDAEIAL